METKLTLKLKKNIIDRAKKYASERETSLSKLIENYLEAITSPSTEKDNISPLVKSISGVIKLADDFNHKDNYHQHLNEKYL
jgi:dsDNA-specific endonuclease/ATPase MutS2